MSYDDDDEEDIYDAVISMRESEYQEFIKKHGEQMTLWPIGCLERWGVLYD